MLHQSAHMALGDETRSYVNLIVFLPAMFLQCQGVLNDAFYFPLVVFILNNVDEKQFYYF